jgi:hypothetical protein
MGQEFHQGLQLLGKKNDTRELWFQGQIQVQLFGQVAMANMMYRRTLSRIPFSRWNPMTLLREKIGQIRKLRMRCRENPNSDYDLVFARVYCYVISRHKRNTGKNVNI